MLLDKDKIFIFVLMSKLNTWLIIYVIFVIKVQPTLHKVVKNTNYYAEF